MGMIRYRWLVDNKDALSGSKGPLRTGWLLALGVGGSRSGEAGLVGQWAGIKCAGSRERLAPPRSSPFQLGDLSAAWAFS